MGSVVSHGKSSDSITQANKFLTAFDEFTQKSIQRTARTPQHIDRQYKKKPEEKSPSRSRRFEKIDDDFLQCQTRSMARQGVEDIDSVPKEEK